MRTLLIVGLVVGSLGVVACTVEDDGGAADGSSRNPAAPRKDSKTRETSETSATFSYCAGGEQPGCTFEEVKEYSDCYQSACSEVFSRCFGPGYLSGEYAGACGSALGCMQKCACDDFSCTVDCLRNSPQRDECGACMEDFSTCGASCKPPECADTRSDAGTPTGDGACKDLEACCDEMTNAAGKRSCEKALDGARGDDSVCLPYLNGYRTGGLCP